MIPFVVSVPSHEGNQRPVSLYVPGVDLASLKSLAFAVWEQLATSRQNAFDLLLFCVGVTRMRVRVLVLKIQLVRRSTFHQFSARDVALDDLILVLAKPKPC